MTSPTLQDYDDLSFLLALRKKGVVLCAEGEDLVCRGNAQALTKEVLARLRSRKSAIMALLAQEQRASDLPQLVADPEQRFAPFPLTENQQAYWLGRDTSMAFGNVGIHVFFEIELQDFSRQRFEDAWNCLLRRHDMLRARVLPDGTQQVLASVPAFHLAVTDLRGLSQTEQNSLLAVHADRLSHTCYALEHWPQTSFQAFVLPDGKTRLMASIDCWCLDGHSLQILMRELAALYRGEELPPAPACTFRDYVLALTSFRTSRLWQQSLAYWHRKLQTLPPAPVLPGRQASHRPDALSARPVFRRLEDVVAADAFAALVSRLRSHDLTLSAFLLTCYAEVLGHWSSEPRFTINVPRSNRLPLHKDIDACAGEFASFSLTAMDLSDPQQTFLARCKAVQKQVWEDLEHDHVSGVTVLRAWRQQTGAGTQTGMPFVFTSEPESGGRGRDSSWIAALEQMGTVCRTLTTTPQVWLDAQYGRIRDRLHLSWDVLEGVFAASLPECMFAACVRLIRAMAADDAPWQQPHPLCTAVTTGCSYSVENGPVLPLREEGCLDILAARASTRGHETALTDSAGSLTWQESLAVVRSLCNALHSAGCGRGSRVGLLLHKGRWQALASFAVHAAGGILVPLDADAPESRLRSMLHSCGAGLVLTDGSDLAGLSTVLDLPACHLPAAFLSAEFRDMPALRPADPVCEEELFALIHTSGSTGTPKAVMVPCRGVVNAMEGFRRMADLGQDTPALALSPFHHDMAMPDYMGNLLLGIPLVYPEHVRRKDPQHWLELITRHAVGFWNSVPAMMTMLMEYMAAHDSSPLTSLRLVTLGGDWLPLATVAALLARAPRARVYSIGGPTEISLANICFPVTAIDPAWTSIPYGRPFPNTGYEVRNALGQLCPRGVAGELCCTGAFMSPGYLGDAERTRRAFTVTQDGRRLYHTGDMGRMREDGVIEFLGRKDTQVKIHGYRIELSEIEHVLRCHTHVHEAVVCLHESSRLCAWIQTASGVVLPEQELRSFAADRLPSYMVPAFFGFCQAFPLTANGKLDRRTIAGWPAVQKAAVCSPQTAAERSVCAAWKEVLGHAPASVHSNFFEAGGDSLSAIRLLNLLHARGSSSLSVMDIFRYPTPATLAQRVQGSAADEADLPPLRPCAGRNSPSADGTLTVPATSAQARLWLEARTRPDAAYILPFRFRVSGSIDPLLLEQALNAVLLRHEALRTTVHGCPRPAAEGQPDSAGLHIVQKVHRDCRLVLQKRDLRGSDQAGQQADAFFRELATVPFDLEQAPLLRAGLVLLAASEAELILVFHHAIFDGWSMQIVLRSLQEALQHAQKTPQNAQGAQGASQHMVQDKACTHAAAPAARKTPDYADLGEWEQSAAVQKACAKRLRTLTKALARVQAPQLPDWKALSRTSETCEATLFCELTLSPACAQLLQARAASAGITPFIFGLAAFTILVSRISGEENLLLGTYAALRSRPEFETIAGLLVNPVPLIVPAGSASSTADILSLCRTAVIEAAECAVLPFDRLVREVAPERRPGRHPLFELAFSQDNTGDAVISAAGMQLELLPGGRHGTAMSLEVAMRSGEHPAFEAVADGRLWTEEALQAFVQRLSFVLEQILHKPDLPLADISLCTDTEKAALAASSTTAPLPGLWPSLWERCTAIAAAKPHTICLFGREECTYAELIDRAGQLAAHMERAAAQGCIALFLARGPALVAAMLAAWRNGRCVLPLSRLQPVLRNRQMLTMAAPGLLVTDSTEQAAALLGSMDSSLCPVLVLDELQHGLSDERQDKPRGNLQNELQDNLQEGLPDEMQAAAGLQQGAGTDDAAALMLFTSGSTGTPKGVVIGSRALVNRLQWAGEVLPYAADERACARADIGFIDATTELFGPLLHGIPVHVLPDEDIVHLDRLFALLHAADITRLVAVPGALRTLAALANLKKRPLAGIRVLISSGEPLYGPLLQELQQAFPNARICNFYGSTEMTGEAAWHSTTREDAHHAAVPLGRPLAGTTVHVRDTQGRILPWGIPGELYVQGAALALGYLAADGSVRDFATGPVRELATGDLGCRTSDGLLLGLGRRDRQLKIRGQRLAPREVELALESMADIEAAVVFTIRVRDGQDGLGGQDGTGGKDKPCEYGEDILCACISGTTRPSDQAIRAHLSARLPQAFLPTLILHCREFPATASGKVDTEALRARARALSQQDTCARAQAASLPLDESQDTFTGRLAGLWRTVLHKPALPDSHFFLEGGHSLLAVRLAALAAAQLPVACEAQDIFLHPVFADLADCLQARAAAGMPCNNDICSWEEV